MMIYNDQVRDEPVAGDPGEPEKETAQEDKNSSPVSSGSKEETKDKPETPVAAEPAARDQDKDTPLP